MAAWTKHGIVALALGTAACTTPQLATPESGIAVPDGWAETRAAPSQGT